MTSRCFLAALALAALAVAAAPACPAGETAAPTLEEQVTRSLQQPVTFALDNTPLPEALAYLADLSRLTIVADPGQANQTPISLQAEGMTLENALQLIARLAGLQVCVNGGVVYLYPEGRPAGPGPLADDGTLAEALARPMSLEFNATPLAEALDYFRQLLQAPLAFKGETATPVTIRADNLPTAEVLRWVCFLGQTEPCVAGGTITVLPQGPLAATATPTPPPATATPMPSPTGGSGPSGQ